MEYCRCSQCTKTITVVVVLWLVLTVRVSEYGCQVIGVDRFDSRTFLSV